MDRVVAAPAPRVTTLCDMVTHDQLAGLGMIVAGGVAAGLYTTPMKWMPSWRWENVWLVYCLWGMLALPWALNFATVPELGEVYGGSDLQARRSAPRSHSDGRMLTPPVGLQDLGIVALFGAGWGCGSITFGLGTFMVGNSLGFSIILGLTCTLGGTVVLLVQDAGQVRSRPGAT